MPRDYYEVLGVDRGADDNQIKKAFRRLARELHPDVNAHDPQAEEKFKEAAEAYEVLSDSERRQLYDAYGHEGLKSGGYAPNFGEFGSISDLFSAFFGGGGFETAFGNAGGATRGADVAVRTDIELTDAATGSQLSLEYEVQGRCGDCHGNGATPGTPIVACTQCQGTGQLQSVAKSRFGQLVRTSMCPICSGSGKVPSDPCKSCSGSGISAEQRKLKVDIPAGIADGQRIRLSGRGHAGTHGGPDGDLYVLVSVREDERFLRDGPDLVTVVDLLSPNAALGTTVSVPTLDGAEDLKVPAGTQPGAEFVLRGKGMPDLHGGRRGDIRVIANVETPRRLTNEQRELLEQLADTMTEENGRSDEGMISKLKRVLAR